MSPSELSPSYLTPLERGGRAQAVRRRLARAIELGHLPRGGRLPAEADLAAQLDVATVTLREALAALRDDGLVETRRGRGGGTFVRGPRESRAEALAQRLRALPVDELRDLGDHAAAVRGAAAKLAAERAGPSDLERLRAALADERRFHVEVAAAAHSPRLARAELALQADAGDLLLTGGPFDSLVAAIARGDGSRARRIAENHVARLVRRLAELHLAARAESQDGIVAPIERIFTALDAIAELVGARPPRRRRDLKALKPHLLAQLADPLVAGAGVILAPGLLSDAPRWLEWYWRSGRDEPPRRLAVELDPAHPDYYDYERAGWFEEPRRTRARALVGPHVDYGATRQHLVTPSVPILAGDQFLGVAAADLRVGDLEPLVPRGVLVNAEGRVIAGDSPRHLAGTLLDGERVPVGRLPWALVIPTPG